MSVLPAAAGRSSDRRLVAASGVGPAILALAGLGLSLTRPRFDDLVTGHEIGDTAMALASGLVFLAIGLGDGLSMLGSGLGDIVPVHATGYPWAVWLSAWTWAPGLLLAVTVLPLVFPEGVRGHLQRRLWRVDIVLIAAVCAGQAFSVKLHSGPHSIIDNPVGIPGADVVGNLAIVAALASAAVSLTMLVVHLVRADDALRRQLLPLVAAGVIVVGAVTGASFLGTAGVILQDGCLLLIPAAALLSVLRLRLYEIEVAIGRTASWIALSGLLLALYVFVVEVISSSLHVHGRIGSVTAAAVVALVFGPLRALLQRGIARWLYGDRGDPYVALAHTTQVLAGGADPLGALRQAAEDLAYRLRSPGVRIIHDGVLLAGRAGGRAALVVPLRSGTEEVGRLEILPRAVGEAFSRADERLILDLCAPLTNAVAAVGLTEELRSSRERLAVARDAERRRVREELHDDVGPSLAAAALQAQTARRRLQRDDRAGADDALHALSTTILRAASDVRSAIDALGPRALDEVGLADAICSLARSYGDPAVVADVDDLGVLPGAVEVAVYRVIAEALTNAQRHAGANSIAVRVGIADDRLQLSVCDDGCGNATSRPGGVGIASMRARIAQVGGDLVIEPVAGGTGTAVKAWVPVPTATGMTS